MVVAESEADLEGHELCLIWRRSSGPIIRRGGQKFSLLENGIDFIRSGIERHFLRDTATQRDRKDAVLHIFAGVLLLMKERATASENPQTVNYAWALRFSHLMKVPVSPAFTSDSASQLYPVGGTP